MNKRAGVITLLIVALGLYGCASSKVNKLETDLINRTERLSYDIRNLNQEVETLKAAEAQPSEDEAARLEAVEGQQEKVRDDLAQMRDKLAVTEAELSDTKKELADVKEELGEKESAGPAPAPAPAPAPRETAKPAAQAVAKPQKTAVSPRIKVLGGDGQISSAKAMAGRLEGMGYSVERTDRANSKYSGPVVYYAANFEGAARDITGRLGGGAIAKPLTWNSVFDIIVMTEK